ncbi:MAG: glycosyltransferase family 4 protein [Euryarchaeota archaeon]|nr:glycosyltransferase family 4 protein [Euryarchaeota archaeon]MDE1835766.1 glycosyltransferase family 4 protein [Euryarchaeota archaeon]MDE1881530.1 glycosyltransferase family 4 protein [Euryarchaeota archaeon]MDE2043957.1 glycosyltransferase family 4 protein [Thermoplasmata archaeon]
MRVAQVLLRYDAPGGVETHVRELSRALRSAGDEVTVYASDLYSEQGWKRIEVPSTELDGIPVRRFPAVRRLVPGLTLPLLPGLVRALDEDRPEVIHAHSHRYGHVLESALVARARHLPLIVGTHYHPADPWEPPWKKGMLRGQDHLFGMTAYRTARALVVETEHEAVQVREFAPPEKVRVVPPGIDLASWSSLPTPREARRLLGLDEPYVLYAGRLAPNKGLRFLLEAWAGLPAKERPPWVVVGEDWGMRSTLEERARALGVAGEIKFLGNLAEPERYRAAFAGAMAFVLPSEYEAFGLVLLEAMAARLPVVATSVGGVPEVVEEGRTALLVPSANVEALRGALRTLLGDPGRARAMGEDGRRRVEERFSWTTTAERIRAIYRGARGEARASG